MEEAPASARVPEWTLAGPMAEVGVTEGGPADELHDVAGAVRLADGRLVILDAGSAQLRMFDSSGEFLIASGGRGGGPGEFRRPARVHLTHPDSLLVDDPVLRRSSRFDTGGRFIWSEPWPESADAFPRDVWLYGRHLVDGPARTDLRGPVRRVLDGMARPGPGSYRHVVVDAFWRVWIRAEPRDPARASLWTVWNLAGEQMARVQTPAGLEPLQFGADFVVGLARDSLGVERVRAYALEGAPEAVPAVVRSPGEAPAGDGEPGPPPEAAVRRLTAALRHVQAAQEAYYSRAGRGAGYAGSVASLELEDGALQQVEVHIVRAGPAGYTVLAFDAREPVACGLTVGLGGPIGWSPGVALCR